MRRPAVVCVGSGDSSALTVETAYHAGVSWWQDGEGRTPGKVVSKNGDRFPVDPLTAKSDIPALAGEWKQFMETVAKTKRRDGQPTQRVRLSDEGQTHLPGFAPGDEDAVVRVLGPIETTINGKATLPALGADSKNTNGNSVLLRIDYGNARILLTC